MKRILCVMLGVAGLAAGLAGCDKPTADECRGAIENMQKLMGTASSGGSTDIPGEIRRCRGGSTKEAIQCASGAKTLDELKACKFMAPKTAPAS